MSEWYNPETDVPENDESVLVICSGKWTNVTLWDAYELAVYDEKTDKWHLEAFPEMSNLVVKWWCYLPPYPTEEKMEVNHER